MLDQKVKGWKKKQHIFAALKDQLRVVCVAHFIARSTPKAADKDAAMHCSRQDHHCIIAAFPSTRITKSPITTEIQRPFSLAVSWIYHLLVLTASFLNRPVPDLPLRTRITLKVGPAIIGDFWCCHGYIRGSHGHRRDVLRRCEAVLRYPTRTAKPHSLQIRGKFTAPTN